MVHGRPCTIARGMIHAAIVLFASSRLLHAGTYFNYHATAAHRLRRRPHRNTRVEHMHMRTFENVIVLNCLAVCYILFCWPLCR